MSCAGPAGPPGLTTLRPVGLLARFAGGALTALRGVGGLLGDALSRPLLNLGAAGVAVDTHNDGRLPVVLLLAPRAGWGP
jgi:hypothetical protein